jgi:hypothetical protein
LLPDGWQRCAPLDTALCTGSATHRQNTNLCCCQEWSAVHNRVVPFMGLSSPVVVRSENDRMRLYRNQAHLFCSIAIHISPNMSAGHASLLAFLRKVLHWNRMRRFFFVALLPVHDYCPLHIGAARIVTIHTRNWWDPRHGSAVWQRDAAELSLTMCTLTPTYAYLSCALIHQSTRVRLTNAFMSDRKLGLPIKDKKN